MSALGRSVGEDQSAFEMAARNTIVALGAAGSLATFAKFVGSGTSAASGDGVACRALETTGAAGAAGVLFALLVAARTARVRVVLPTLPAVCVRFASPAAFRPAVAATSCSLFSCAVVGVVTLLCALFLASTTSLVGRPRLTVGGTLHVMPSLQHRPHGNW